MFATIYQIARNTFRETLREPIYLILLLTALALIGIYPLFSMFVFRQQIKLVVDSSMATTMVFGWIVAVLSASHAIAREINNGTALLLLSKPVNRPVFIFAKIVGILAAVAVFCVLTSIATMVSVRVAKDQFRLDTTALTIYFGAIVASCLIGALRNYFAQRQYPMSCVLSMLVTLPLGALIIWWVPVNDEIVGLNVALIPALILVFYSVCAMATLATALSTRLDLVANLMVCGVIFVIGLMSDYLVGRHAAENWLAAVVYAAIPNWQLFWMADALAAGKQVPGPYVVLGGAYVVLFLAVFTSLAIGMFQNREVGEQIVA